tara:strand:+ start:1668 stop:2210 length:543 start_codon:yes stop_codon:yes gene_type:complete
MSEKNIKEVCFLDKLKQGTEYKKTFPVPKGLTAGQDLSVVLRVLSDGEIERAKIDAQKAFDSEGLELSESTIEILEMDRTIRQVYLAAADTSGQPLAPTYAAFKGSIVAEFREWLCENYLSTQRTFSPMFNDMDGEDFNDLIKNVKKKPSATIADIYDIEFLKKVIITLAKPRKTSQRDK